MAVLTCNFNLVARVLSIVAGICMAVAGIIGVAEHHNFASVMLSVYLILFAILSLVVDAFHPHGLLVYAGFLSNFFGRGCFFTVTGTMALSPAGVIGLVLALCILSVAVFHFLLACAAYTKSDEQGGSYVSQEA